MTSEPASLPFLSTSNKTGYVPLQNNPNQSETGLVLSIFLKSRIRVPTYTLCIVLKGYIINNEEDKIPLYVLMLTIISYL